MEIKRKPEKKATGSYAKANNQWELIPITDSVGSESVNVLQATIPEVWWPVPNQVLAKGFPKNFFFASTSCLAQRAWSEFSSESENE
ncbi:hypothetical protein [Nostoc sp. 'Lobaria pulmonaria (5183) cyanobiont']|uniref:hypothetical protein n=1 Tax=Nostoc sp. 'Lobaria pulmonaria (5183) cyanobiont' TaxID=1618022 RepID=UPI000CF30D19|nr:hypothetical protein [Nostoc sp. 'Lobaria pulmonaria (5183) cyanobiont']